MIVLDAPVLIAFLEATDAQHARARALFDALAGRPLRASPITLAEVLVGPASRGGIDRAEAVLEALAVIDVPVSAGAPRRLAMLRAETGLKLPDCALLLAAEECAAATTVGVATFDQRLARVASARGYEVHR